MCACLGQLPLGDALPGRKTVADLVGKARMAEAFAAITGGAGGRV